MVNLILLTNCNSSIKNPGPPKNLSVLYQNVQGLIPVSELGEEHPTLNENKLLELQAYVYHHSPDIVVLNETWLKCTVNDNEIFPPESYKIFRRDRSPESHPPDPNNPKKFKRNGGGVLIAVKSSLELTSKRVNNEYIYIYKLCLSTLYRVGTLGTRNQQALQEYYSSLLRNRKYSKMYVIGDLNLPSLSRTEWSTGQGTQPLCQSFLDMFNNMNFEQCIEQATHNHGKILDVLLTNAPQSIARVSVGDENSVCASDHFPIFFNVKANIRRKQAIKREIFNFKKADWNELNRDLSNAPWHSLLSSPDIEVCWHNFKLTLDNISKKHIPVIKSKDGFKPPWFDSEVYDLCRDKERIRLDLKALKKKRDLTQTLLDQGPSCQKSQREQYDKKLLRLELNFQSTRREMKHLIRSKMYSNFSDKQSENAITKKFWSYVKATSNSHRIPEIVHNNGIFKSDFKGQADLFNSFFFDQFSSESNYKININYNRPNQVHFSVPDVKNILKNLDPNKAPGPDQIHGKILKNCANALCTPLTLLFQSSFYTCNIPNDWKTANVVPVYKKGLKNCMNDLNDKKTKTDKKAGATRNKVVKSPVKTPSSFDYECLCPCKEYIVGEFSVGCEQCEKFWHYGCVGLKGLTEEMGRLLVNWLCPDCFKSPHSYKEVSKNDSVENKAVRAIIQEELQLFAPKLTRSLNDVINGNTEKTVKEAVHLYSEVTAKSQKKVIEDLSTAQASENVISKVQTKMHTDAFERNQRKLNLCVLKVPESKKDTSKQRQEDDAKFCLETLKIKKRDFISCHRAGKPDSEKPDYCRPLIIKTADEIEID
ncbi:hypothetical protein ACHWQZ_G005303 [Mnemiopsis leidyi]